MEPFEKAQERRSETRVWRRPHDKHPIRTVFIAGMDKPDNLFSRNCQKSFLKVVHWATNMPGQELPKCDAAIIALSNTSHDLMFRVKEAYDRKPCFMAQQGYSSIKEAFEDAVFGEGVMQILQSPATFGNPNSTGNLSVAMKIAWILARFYDREMSFKVHDFKEAVKDFFGLPDNDTTIASLIAYYKKYGNITSSQWGHMTFHGITEQHYQGMLKNGLPADEKWVYYTLAPKEEEENEVTLTPWNKPRVFISPKKVTTEIDEVPFEPAVVVKHEESQTPAPAPVDVNLKDLHDHATVSMELLLDAMAKQQAQFDDLSKNLEATVKRSVETHVSASLGGIQLTIQSEIRGVTGFLGEVVPELHGLSQNQLSWLSRLTKKLKQYDCNEKDLEKIDDLLSIVLEMKKRSAEETLPKT